MKLFNSKSEVGTHRRGVRCTILCALCCLLFNFSTFAQVNTNAWVWANFEDLNGFETMQLTVASTSNAFAVYPNIVVRKNKTITAYNGVISNQYSPGGYQITTPLGDVVNFALPPGFDNTHVFNVLDLTNSLTNFYAGFPNLTHSNGIIITPTNFWTANVTLTNVSASSNGMQFVSINGHLYISNFFNNAGGGNSGTNTLVSGGNVNLQPVITNLQMVSFLGNGANTNSLLHLGGASGAPAFAPGPSNMFGFEVEAPTNTFLGGSFRAKDTNGNWQLMIDSQGGLNVGSTTFAGAGNINATNALTAHGGAYGLILSHSAGQDATRFQLRTSDDPASNSFRAQLDTSPGEANGGHTAQVLFYTAINGVLTNLQLFDPLAHKINFSPNQLIGDGSGLTNLPITALSQWGLALSNGLLVISNAPSTNITKASATIATNATLPTRGFLETINGLNYFTPDIGGVVSNITTIKTSAVSPITPFFWYDGSANLFLQGWVNSTGQSNFVEFGTSGGVTIFQPAGQFGETIENTNVGAVDEARHVDNGTNTVGFIADKSANPHGTDPRGAGSKYAWHVVGDGSAMFRQIREHWPLALTNYTIGPYSDHVLMMPTNGPATVILPCLTNTDNQGFEGRGMHAGPGGGALGGSYIYADDSEAVVVWNVGTNPVTCFTTNHNVFNTNGVGPSSSFGTNFIVYPGQRITFVSPDGTNIFATGNLGGTNYLDGSQLTNLNVSAGGGSGVHVTNYPGTIVNHTNLTFGPGPYLTIQVLTNASGPSGTAIANCDQFTTTITNTLKVVWDINQTNWDLYYGVLVNTGTTTAANVPYWTNVANPAFANIPYVDASVYEATITVASKNPFFQTPTISNFNNCFGTALGNGINPAIMRIHAAWHNP